MNIFKLSLLAVLSASLMFGGAGCKKNVKAPTQIPANKIVGIADNPKTSQQPPVIGNGLTGQGSGLDSANTKTKDYTLPNDTIANKDGTVPMNKGYNPDDFTEDRITFKTQTVYFDFDRATVRASERNKVEEVVAVLKGQSQNMVLIEGHCDERGTEEYNRALGERRALAIREYLVNAGIQAERVHTISYGEDKPAELGTGESAWAKNRRGEFILLKPRQ